MHIPQTLRDNISGQLSPYNYKHMEKYEQEALDNANRLADEVRKFKNSDSVQVIKGEERTDYRVILTEEGKEYQIRKDYRGFISVIQTQKSHTNAPSVSSSTYGDLRREDATQNMKVMTATKLNAKIEAEKIFNQKLAKAEFEAGQKVVEFMKTLKDLPVKFFYNHDKTQIAGGYIEKNGLEFSFEIGTDGYISKKIRLITYDNSLETFLAISDNKFVAKN